MISDVFIARPRFAFVISIVVVLAGLIAITQIPVAQYPDLVPPQVVVTTTFPGASAATVEASVAQPIEAQVNGVDKMLYMTSTSGNDGSYTLTVSFAVGSDPNIDTVNVQNRVNLAETQLPPEVNAQGLTIRQRSSALLQVIEFYSPNQSHDGLFLNNYVTINVLDTIARVPGVGQAQLFAKMSYSMRIWFDTDRLTGLAMVPGDVIKAVQQQNLQAPVGRLGAQPAAPNQQFQLPLQTLGRLSTVPQFDAIVIRANPDGSLVRLGDVARVEMGAQSSDTFSRYNGSPAASLAIYLAPGANAVAAAGAVQSALQRLAQRYPDDMRHVIVFDSTTFVYATIEEVIRTLAEAFALVVLVVFLFLGSWRATLVPIVAVPVSLIGAFAVLLALGYSANTITLLALVLSIGIVVDDAIVVVENVQRVMEERALPAKEATRQAMAEITAPVIAISLVLLSVFVPVGFIPGIAGVLFRQFAVAVSAAVVISTINALTLSPALCSLLLRPGVRHGVMARVGRGIEWIQDRYAEVVRRLVKFAAFSVPAIVLAAGIVFLLLRSVPTGFLPEEDQGAFFTEVQLPAGASLNRTDTVTAEVEKIIRAQKGVASVTGIVGFSQLNSTALSNSAFLIVRLLPFEQRTDPEESVAAIIANVRRKTLSLPGANVLPFNLPPIIGLGSTGGFQYELEAIGEQTPAELAASMRALMFAANQQPELAAVFSTYNAETPQVYLDIDRNRAQILGVSVSDIFLALQATLGGYFINQFNAYGRIWQVNMQAASGDRSGIEDIYRINVANAKGEMVPLRSLLSAAPILGPQQVTRYNNLRAVTFNGTPAPGYSSGQALDAMERVSQQVLPEGDTFEWTGTALQERQVAGQTGYVLAVAVLFAYLFLVVLYESWAMPLAVLLSVTIALVGALLALRLSGLSNDLFAQIGIVVLIALASKNAILIIEFAMDRHAAGAAVEEAAVAGARMRIRPVLMTSLAFVLGLLPLVVAVGAAMLTRRDIGTAVFGGMIAATSIGVFVIPLLYVVFQRLRIRRR
ncbi:MAG: multidrug efflux RND transporter permease subunit [Alphaproteobacteria bacterium]|nr:multidrug efflux RND transporter permease subunit [Alphaproteobacteria bacterium]MBV8412912.1 multidrug efflux RND transporter permease subunit [Alphaproteobacteria bacterium]